MKIVLLEDVPKLGRKYEIKEVANGHARNFLIRQNKAKKADAGAEEYYKEKREKHLNIVATSHQELKSKISEIKEVLVFKLKANDEGKLFGSIDVLEIADLLFEKTGFKIEPAWIILQDNIKTLGDYELDIVDPHDQGKESLGKIKISVEKE